MNNTNSARAASVASSDVSYVLGLDLGQSRDPTALAVVRRLGDFGLWGEGEASEVYQVGHLERLPLGTSYPRVVSHVKFVLSKLPRGTELVVDFTGVGRPVFDMFLDVGGIDPIGVVITGGNTESSADARIFSVPKINLISWVQALLHQERLKIQRELPESGALVRELSEFRVDFTASGHMTFNARSGSHDDLLLALCIACWRAKVAGGPSLLSFYRSQSEIARSAARQEDRQQQYSASEASGAQPFRRMVKQVREDANELTELYLRTLNGMTQSDLCDSCSRPLGVTRFNDGVFRWHPDCPVPH
jgi:hypothetical protein